MKLMLLGDTHGNTGWAQDRAQLAKDLGCQAIIQLGDFGIWPGPLGDKFLRKLNDTLNSLDLMLYFVDGNHEDFPKLAKLSRHFYGGFNYLDVPGAGTAQRRIVHATRGNLWNWHGISFMSLGGAVSIDRSHRVPGKSWWPEETLTTEQVAYASRVAQTNRVDVFLSHDCPTNVPFAGLKNDPDSHAHRQAITSVAELAKPKLWFHGHMHREMHYPFGYPPNITQVYGLDCDGSDFGYAILELPSLKVTKAAEHQWMEKAY